MNVLEFNPDETILVNGAYLNSFRILVDVSGARTWHYYGTLIPGSSIAGVPAVQHDAITIHLDTPDLVDSSRLLAKDAAVAALVA